MNYLVFLDPDAGELEKILSGIKSMLIKEYDPAQSATQTVTPGDSLYFLRNKDDRDVRVMAVVVNVSFINNGADDNRTHSLNELQPKLQLTEDQYLFWIIKKQILLIEFEDAQKIDVIHLPAAKVIDRSNWIAFDKEVMK
jgi:hypothetical protein